MGSRGTEKTSKFYGWGNNQNQRATDLICTPNLCQTFISPDFGIELVHWNANWHDCFHPWNGWVEKFVATTHTWQKPLRGGLGATRLNVCLLLLGSWKPFCEIAPYQRQHWHLQNCAPIFLAMSFWCSLEASKKMFELMVSMPNSSQAMPGTRP